MTIIEWRNNPMLTQAARDLIAAEPFRSMLAVLKDHPTLERNPLGTSADDKAAMLGRMVGFRDCIAVIEEMGRPLPENRAIESTFAPTETE